ncbi:PKD domain-containing protein [Colwellia sp. 12G3]|uniref:PKD domain-containing protein n=1 Tax=Colwellia sp. 12G3 TaxID=2058299 RepID=UPI000C322375|nr:PKD domain-containing protein [Colwellia sp. 12G3]PKI12630.1 hypothetical protein CXF71_17960 [Colwellia sp. 12G3]
MMLQRGATAVLNGSGSYDPYGAPLTYFWRVVSQPTTSTSKLSDSSSPFPSLYLDEFGDYKIELIVNNGEEDSLPVILTISDSDSLPIANAGLDRKSQTGDAVTLDGSLSFDSDGDLLSYTWTLVSIPSGSAAILARADSPYAILTPDVAGDYEVQLVVSDGSSDSLADRVLISDKNLPPVADAGVNTTFFVGTSLVLDGTGSSDVDGDSLSYQWRIVSAPAGSTTTIVDATAVKASITPDMSGDFVLSLTVNDGQVDSEVSTVILHKSNHIPIANAGADISGQLGQLAHLDGSGSRDADGDTLTPRWSISSKPKNSAVTLADTHTFHPSLTPDVAGHYVVQLIIYDGQYLSTVDSVTISTKNLAPTANAGAPMLVVTGQKINLDGTQSTDPEGAMLSYHWSLVSAPSGSAATLSAKDIVAPEFTPDELGNYVFQLIVNDGERSSAPATVIISDQDLPPMANAGEDQSSATSVLVTLDGSTSSDPELQPLSYDWSMLSSPSGSATVVNDSRQAIASLMPDRAGDYVVQLTVTDPTGQKSSDVVVIRDGASNTLPVADAGPDRQVDLNANLVLDGSGSSDADNDALNYSWAILSRPVGSLAQLNKDKTRNPDFTPDVQGDFVIQLFVSDGKSISLPDVVVIHDTEKNIEPVARIGSTLDGITGTSYTLDGSNSFDGNSDTLTYNWILFTPSASLATLSDSTVAQPVFTPDVAGNYTVTLAVNDGQLNSHWISETVSVKDPIKGAAIPLPPGHNLMMLSATGGDSGSGSLISLEERDLTKATEILSLHGLPRMGSIDHVQSPVLHPSNEKMYALIDATGLHNTGVIIEFDPATNTAVIFANAPDITLNGHRVRQFRHQILFHPDGKSMFIFTLKGGTNDAGVLIHVNADPSSADYRGFSVIAEFGIAQGSFPGSRLAPYTDLAWNGNSNKILAAFGSLRSQALSAIEMTPTDNNNLSQAWSIAEFGSPIEANARKFVVDQDYMIMLESFSPLILTGNGRNGGGGFTLRDCHNAQGTFRWGLVDIYVMCDGSAGFAPGLYRTNGAVTQPVAVRSFSNLQTSQVSGVTASIIRDTAYMNIVDESASTFIGFNAASLGISIASPTLSEVTKGSYVDRPIITGGGDRGTYFIGDPAILDRASDSINDRFVTTLSYDGGVNKRGALLTADRLNNSVQQFDFGFENGGFPFGRVTKASTGDYFFSTISGSASSNSIEGATIHFDSALGVTQEIAPSKYFRAGIGLGETSSNTLYGLGVDLRRQVYALYSIDVDTLAINELADFDTTTARIPSYELVVDNDNLWFFTDNKLYCVDPASMQRGVHDFMTNGPHDPVRALSFATAGGNGYFVTRESASPNQGTIQQVQNDCATPTITDAVTGLIDLPSTALLAASDGKFYYGTEGGKLMQFDGASTVTEVAAITNTSMVGFLIEDANGDIVGFASNGNVKEDHMYAYKLSGGAFTKNVVPADTPIDTFYPGVTEIN